MKVSWVVSSSKCLLLSFASLPLRDFALNSPVSPDSRLFVISRPERQFDALRDEAKDAFLLRLFSDDQFHRMTTQHAELKSFAALAPETLHAGIALDGKTERATMRDFRFRMP